MQRIWRIVGALLSIAFLGFILAAAQQLWGSGADRQLWLEQSLWQRPAAKVLAWVNDSLASWLKAPQLARQNLALLESNRSLQAKVTELQALERENQELRAMLKLKQRFPVKSVAAEVIVRDPQGWYAQIVVDKGSAEGVSESMVAIASGNLVGKVSEVGKHSALVHLITSESVVVPVKLAKNGATGVMYGENDAACKGRYFHRDVKAAPQDVVLTSGLGDIYPGGLMIGRIGPQSSIRENLFQEMTIVPAADLTALRYVVLVQKQ
ncbi:MAG: rod shape-determining protein MreC [bacterium]|nr:rod shape-determining protein MreC [bacterium]